MPETARATVARTAALSFMGFPIKPRQALVTTVERSRSKE